MKLLTSVLALSLGLAAATANAALQSRLGGLALYDTDLNITWLADANYAKTSGYNTDGLMTWTQANTWAAGLTVGGVSGWRLPATLQPDPSCGMSSKPISFVLSYGGNCTGSEMGHLFYKELGGVAGQSILTAHNANYSLFRNFQANPYPSGTWLEEPTHITGWVFYFNFTSGEQSYLDTGALKYSFYNMTSPALAVHSGDIAAVPVPGAVWLLGSGLLGLIGVARRRY